MSNIVFKKYGHQDEIFEYLKPDIDKIIPDEISEMITSSKIFHTQTRNKTESSVYKLLTPSELIDYIYTTNENDINQLTMRPDNCKKFLNFLSNYLTSEKDINKSVCVITTDFFQYLRKKSLTVHTLLVDLKEKSKNRAISVYFYENEPNMCKGINHKKIKEDTLLFFISE
jgi:hypothetical protein